MATLKQMEANRANAKKPIRNAIRHGLTATRTLVGCENALEYHQIRGALYRDYAPANTQEEILVDRIASATWRSLRSRQMEQSLCNMSIDNFQAKRKRSVPRTSKTDTEALVLSMVEEDLWRLMHRYDTQISRDFFRSIAMLEKLQADRRRRDRQELLDCRQAHNDGREDRKLALREQREQRQTEQTKQQSPPNWLPFEKTRTAQATAPAAERNSLLAPPISCGRV